jgi:hypothetical protein
MVGLKCCWIGSLGSLLRYEINFRLGCLRLVVGQQCSHFQEDLHLGGERQKEVLVPFSTVQVLFEVMIETTSHRSFFYSLVITKKKAIH